MTDVQLIVTVLGVNATGIIVLLAGLFKALQNGAMVTRREAETAAASAAREVANVTADRDMWRDTAQTLNPIVEKVLVGQELTNHLLRSLPGIPEVDG